MASKAKVSKQANNILYLQDADAKALGIVEGSTQRVFIDNREVEVVFVDEHEVIPVSNEDKKLYQEAYKIAAKYAEEAEKGESPASKALVARSEKQPKERREKEYREKSSFSDKWSNFVAKFKKSPEEKAEKEHARQEKANSKAMVKYQESKQPSRYEERQSRHDYNNHKRHAKHSMRNHVFTNEELEIIQSVIDKSRNSSSQGNRNQASNSKIKSKKR